MRAPYQRLPVSSRDNRAQGSPLLLKAMLGVIVVMAFAVLTAVWSQAGGSSGFGGSTMSARLDADSSRILNH
jgi:hypothetical protein